MVEQTKSLAEMKTDLFFKYRFPSKDIEFEKSVGYYYTWVKRFEFPDPTGFMDSDSVEAYKKVLKELYK